VEKIKGEESAKGGLLTDLEDGEKATQESERYRLTGCRFMKRSTTEPKPHASCSKDGS
jgi:hypothetical protein